MKDPTSPLSSIFTPIFLFLLLPCFVSPSPPNYLSRGSSLYVEDNSPALVSPNGSFACCFYNVGSNAYTFSVWFSMSAAKTPAWTANRDHPVNGHGSKIKFRKDGAVLLTDFDDTVIWSTNTSRTGAEQMQLLETGNLVVVDKNGKILWQSFDSSTDTLLPTQPITRNIKLVAPIAKGSLFSGYYKLYFDSNNVLILFYDGPDISSIYWPDPEFVVWENNRTAYNSSKYGVLDEEGQFTSTDLLAFNASDKGIGIRRRLTLDYDGNLRLYSLNQSTGLWLISWEAFPQLCNIFGMCGRNGICSYMPVPHCSCLPGYEMADTTNWNKGCKRKTEISCDRQHYKLLELPNTDFWGYDINFTASISFSTCKEICMADCRCEAFGYKKVSEEKKSGNCYPKNALYNGRATPAVVNNIYLKVPAHFEDSHISFSQVYQLNCNTTNHKFITNSTILYTISSNKLNWAYFYWFIAAFFVVEVFFITFGWWFIFRRGQMPKSLEEGYKMVSSQFRKFAYKELEQATEKFKYELGKGGSGVVYKGVLDDDRVVAVKKLENENQGEEFWAEVGLIGRIYHMNLVRMWGFCSERANKLLVYEYVKYGSLDKILFDGKGESIVLGWRERFKIAVGVAKGLAYLHHECLEWIIHCDVKPENILLGQDFEAKIADFGLAKLLKRGGGGSNVSQIRGTRGYIAPEWASSLPITGKVDVYSYGVVLLELLKGGRVSNWAMDFIDGEEEMEMVSRRLCPVLKEKLKRGEDTWIGNFVDFRLDGQFSCKQAALMVEIAISCLEEDRSKRPTMDNVVQMLLSCDDQTDFGSLSLI